MYWDISALYKKDGILNKFSYIILLLLSFYIVQASAKLTVVLSEL